MQKNNIVQLSGKIISSIERVAGTEICRAYLEVKRISGIADIIPLEIPEYLAEDMFTGASVQLIGKYVSSNQSGRVHLKVSVYHISQCPATDTNINEIYLDGCICKKPVYRITPLGKEITELLLAVNHPYGHSDYIPCITWGPNAVKAELYQVGERVLANGRIQSRQYEKKTGSAKEIRTTYEVSVSKIAVYGGQAHVG